MNELRLKENEYKAYIKEHFTNVNTAFLKYGINMAKRLFITPGALYVRVIKHDDSKYLKEEFDGYRQYFYPCSGEEKNEKLFNDAWKHHYKNNDHHPEYWVDEVTGDIKDMPVECIAEMLLDWEAMSMKFGGNTYDYYMKEKDNKPFSENTKKVIEDLIGLFKGE